MEANLLELVQQCPDINLTIKASDLMTVCRSITDELLAAINNAQAAAKEPIDDLLTREEVMEILGISPATLWRWKKSGYLVPVKVGSLDRYHRSILDKVLRQKGGAL